MFTQNCLCFLSNGAQLVWLMLAGQGDALYLVGLKLHHPTLLPNLTKFWMKDTAGTQNLSVGAYLVSH